MADQLAIANASLVRRAAGLSREERNAILRRLNAPPSGVRRATQHDDAVYMANDGVLYVYDVNTDHWAPLVPEDRATGDLYLDPDGALYVYDADTGVWSEVQ